MGKPLVAVAYVTLTVYDKQFDVQVTVHRDKFL